MPTYYIIMALYALMTAYIVFILIWNLIECDDIWEQIVAVFVLVPFAMRIFFIK